MKSTLILVLILSTVVFSVQVRARSSFNELIEESERAQAELHQATLEQTRAVQEAFDFEYRYRRPKHMYAQQKMSDSVKSPQDLGLDFKLKLVILR